MRLIGVLAQLSAAANDESVPELFRHLVPASALPDHIGVDSPDGDRQSLNGILLNRIHQNSDLPAGLFSDGGSVANKLGEQMDELSISEEQRALFARRFAVMVDNVGKPETAQRIRQRFDAPAVDEEPVYSAEPDGAPQDRHAPDEELPLQQEPWPNFPLPEESEQNGDPHSRPPG